VQFLNEVLGACQNVGMHVVATVCDMGTKSIKALKLLGATKRKPFFQFQNQAITTICDPTHVNAPVTCFYNSMCSLSLSMRTAICLLLLSGTTLRTYTNVTNTA
jgi:hypothetical protein